MFFLIKANFVAPAQEASMGYPMTEKTIMIRVIRLSEPPMPLCLVKAIFNLCTYTVMFFVG